MAFVRIVETARGKKRENLRGSKKRDIVFFSSSVLSQLDRSIGRKYIYLMTMITMMMLLVMVLMVVMMS